MTFWARSVRLAWLGIVRQPVRSFLGVLGVAAVGALLFDMLLLSRGLVLSFRDLLDRAGYDVRVFATDVPALVGPGIADATAVAVSVASLPEVEAVLQLRLRYAEVAADGVLDPLDPLESDVGTAPSPASGPRDGGHRVEFVGVDPYARPLWTLLEGRELQDAAEAMAPLVVNRNLALRGEPGSTLPLRGRCPGGETLPPMVFTIVGIAEFPFDDASALTAAGTLDDVRRLCPDGAEDRVEMLLVRSAPHVDADRAAAAISASHPDLYVVTNEDLIERFSRVEFSYFRQISFVLASVTLFFGFLLIAVLLTVSVNQRLGEIAALRAIGLSRGRVVAGVLLESVMLVGAGGLLALPLGAALSIWLERILHAMPGMPVAVDFFVFEPRVLVLHIALLAAAALGAAAYPMQIVAVLPIAATLRREVVS